MSDDERSNGERRGQVVRWGFWLVVVTAVVVFALANTNKVDVDWVLNSARAPLWSVIAVSAVAGVIVGFLARPRRS
jgi:uncharacterized integral membrane protein